MPDDVVARLERLAARDGTSVAALAVRELSEVSRRADNATLMGVLPETGISIEVIIDNLGRGRADR